MGEDRFPTRIDRRPEFKDRQRLVRADERKRQSRVAEIRNTTRGNGYVFINPDTAKPYTDIKTAFGTACQLAGIENLHWHDQHRILDTLAGKAGSEPNKTGTDRRTVWENVEEVNASARRYPG